jgi:cytochrome P450
LLEAGADTTAVALLVFILAMAAHQEAQSRAQDEIDRVFGDTLPEDIDGTQLPYLRAVFWEVSRFRICFGHKRGEI